MRAHVHLLARALIHHSQPQHIRTGALNASNAKRVWGGAISGSALVLNFVTLCDHCTHPADANLTEAVVGKFEALFCDVINAQPMCDLACATAGWCWAGGRA